MKKPSGRHSLRSGVYLPRSVGVCGASRCKTRRPHFCWSLWGVLMSAEMSLLWLVAALGLPEGATPFPWQIRLLRQLIEGRLPRALDLPTGLGKTSVMAIWLVARALKAPVPRRLVYVVDRRAVVDQATAVAEGLRAWVQSVPEVGAALGSDLPISTLRGQHIDNRAWLADPSAPAVVIGTVDMIGSRLLFSGYGVSRKMRPYHAGLLAADTLLVLDEAHLVPPFERLLDRIASGADAYGHALSAAPFQESGVVPAFRVLALSATGRQRSADETFTLESDDLAHPVVQQRLQAPKRIRLFGSVEAKDLPAALAQHAWDLSGQGRKAGRIIVFTNSREHARKVRQALHKLSGKAAVDVELLVGGRRVYEREQAAERLAALGFLAGAQMRLERPAFVVATAAGEVGVDLDADHAVCDLVAWERMVQRLGRVNRRGTGDASVIVVPADSPDDAAKQRQAAVLELLRMLPLTEDAAANGSPQALSDLKADATAIAIIERASTPAPLHPPLTRALVDAWSMTSLEPHTGRPEVGPWLRGWPDEPEQPQVCVIWRSHLPVDDDGRAFPARQMELFLDAAGPHLAERLETDLFQVLDWLTARVQALPDKALTPSEAGQPVALLATDVVAVLVNEADSGVQVLRGADIARAKKGEIETWLRGKALWVDRRIGGLDGGLLDEAEEGPAADVTELGTLEAPGPVPFRIGREPSLPEPEPGWRIEASLVLRRDEEGVLAWLIVSSLLSQQAGSEEGRSGSLRAQLLVEHQAWAEQAARSLATALHLPPAFTDMLGIAARIHDEGKQADRWQQAFHAPGNGRPPYAKTVGRPNVALLDGYRHEFGSLSFAEANPAVQALPPEWRELCLHLVAAHHGAARPLIRTDGAAEPPSRAAARAREVALRYAALTEHWGPWGLAWWEALLRAADQQASRRNDEQGGQHG